MSTADSNPTSWHSPDVTMDQLSPSPQAIVDNQLLVTTPENIAFHYQVAGPFRRATAFILDILISQIAYWGLAIGVMFVFTLYLFPLTGGPTTGWAASLFGILTGMVMVGAFVVTWFYSAVTETYFNGQSFGKMLTNLRVLCTNGNSINGTQATLRNFFRLLDAWPGISLGFLFGIQSLDNIFLPTFMLGLVMMTISRKYQRIGDLVAGTIVVNEDQRWAPDLINFTDPRVAQLAEILPNDFEVSASMARSLADFTDRRRYLANQRVAEIATHLGPLLIQRFGLPKDTNYDLLLCALYYKTFMADQMDDAHDSSTNASTDGANAAQPTRHENNATAQARPTGETS